MIVIQGKEPLPIGTEIVIETDKDRNWCEVPAKVMREATREDYMKQIAELKANYSEEIGCGPYFYWASVD